MEKFKFLLKIGTASPEWVQLESMCGFWFCSDFSSVSLWGKLLPDPKVDSVYTLLCKDCCPRWYKCRWSPNLHICVTPFLILLNNNIIITIITSYMKCKKP